MWQSSNFVFQALILQWEFFIYLTVCYITKIFFQYNFYSVLNGNARALTCIKFYLMVIAIQIYEHRELKVCLHRIYKNSSTPNGWLSGNFQLICFIIIIFTGIILIVIGWEYIFCCCILSTDEGCYHPSDCRRKCI